MKIVISAATMPEWMPLKEKLEKAPFFSSISFHTSGVGLLISTFSIAELLIKNPPDLIIQIGIAGSFNPELPLGTVVVVKNELLGDTGVYEKETFKDIFDLHLADKNAFPFSDKKLANPWINQFTHMQLLQVNSVTVNEVTTNHTRINHLKQQYDCTIEGMEGAAFHYAALKTNTPFLQIRAISNPVGERDKTKWKIKEALQNLATSVFELVENLQLKPISHL